MLIGFYLIRVTLIVCICNSLAVFHYVNEKLGKNFLRVSEEEKLKLRDTAKEIFYFAYDSYLKYAYPYDELDPIHCTGRGPDNENLKNININDVLGDYSLSLIEALGTLAVLGDVRNFKYAAALISENVNFDKNTTVQVFEATIRVVGGLLSAHLLIIDKEKSFGNIEPDFYSGELLDLAADLASRLLVAFENSSTGLPHPRVNLRTGVPSDGRIDTCTAGAGSLLLEFGILSRLLGDPAYELAARGANTVLWSLRNPNTGLFGNNINIASGTWEDELSGVGAGLDSFYEYMLKAYVLFGNKEDYAKFNETYRNIKRHMRRGRASCNSGVGSHPLYVNVNMYDGSTMTTWIDSLQASFTGVQVLAGDIEEAICSHAFYYMIWKKYGVLPERYNWKLKLPDVKFYPLRPEFVESTYILYRATKNPFYLHVGRDIINSLNNLTRVECGFATVHSVLDMSLEDRMESFFLAETTKYLYLLFDEDNPINRHPDRFMFTTEGHVITIGPWTRNEKFLEYFSQPESNMMFNVPDANCLPFDKERTFGLPLKSDYLEQISSAFGLEL